MLMISDTEAQAAMFLGSLKQELQDNEELIDLFGIKRDDKGLVRFLKDSETDIVVECSDGHKFRVIAKGAEQKLRGLNWNGTRPDLIIGDDIENDELVMNKDRREKMRRWFYSALLPALAPHGIVRIVGTILHMDALLERLMPENQLMSRQKGKFLTIEPLRTYTEHKLPWRSMRYRAHTADFEHILWKERFDEQFFRDKYTDYVAQGLSDAYSQEYLNVPIDESLSYFKRSDFLPMSEENKKTRLNYYITVDLAISQAERADYTVFLIAGIDENKYIHVKNVIRDRLDGKEIVDTILALQRTYNPVAIGIEEMQVSKAIGPFLYEQMIFQNTYPSLVQMKHMGQDKLTRSRSIQARMRAGSIKFDKDAEWYPSFEDECMKFPRDRNDDQVDAFAYLGLLLDKLVEAPTDKEVLDEQYEDELNDSGTHLLGRSAVTGY